MAIDNGDSREAEARRGETVKRRGSISKKSRLQGVRHIRDNVIKRNYHKPNMAGTIERNVFLSVAGIMQKRFTDEEFAAEYDFLPKKDLESDFSATHLNGAAQKGYVVEPGEGDGFMQVSEKGNKPNFDTLIRAQNGKQFQIMPKEYLTFIPESHNREGLMQEAAKFYEAVLRAFEKSKEVAKLNKSKINFKIKGSLGQLLNDIDSLVIYASNNDGAKVARIIFRKELESSGLKVSRFGRPESGFDSWDGKEKFTHRQLVAKAVAKNTVRDYETTKNLSHYSEDQLDDYIQKGTEGYSKMPPERLLASI